MRTVYIILMAFVLTSCMVGPDFQSPKAPNASRYTDSTLKKTASSPGRGGQAQQFVYNADIPAQWWQLFRCPTLNYLITTGLTNSPTVAAAQASLRQAQETYRAQVGNTYYPNVGLQLSAARQLFSGATFGAGTNNSDDVPSNLFYLYNAQVNVSYTLDFFGALRRQVEGLGAQIDNQQFVLEATYLTLAANIATTAITVAALQAQIQATYELIRAQAEILAIMEKQYHLGGVSGSNLLAQQTLLAQSQATLPPLEKSLAQSRHALSVLVGTLPSERQPELDLNQLHLPTKLPVSLPSALVRQRPDIRASEALFHAAAAQVGVATANLYPQITLTGNYGWLGNNAPTLFNPINNAWLISGQLLQPVFNGGALQASRRAAIAAYQAAGAQYRQTVLKAFQNVADTLRALEMDALALRAQQRAENAALSSLRITENQYRLGGVSYLTLLNAQLQYQRTRINRIQAQATRYTDTAALFQSLGGGWWNRTNNA